jgi:hypothetical protein
MVGVLVGLGLSFTLSFAALSAVLESDAHPAVMYVVVIGSAMGVSVAGILGMFAGARAFAGPPPSPPRAQDRVDGSLASDDQRSNQSASSR